MQGNAGDRLSYDRACRILVNHHPHWENQISFWVRCGFIHWTIPKCHRLLRRCKYVYSRCSRLVHFCIPFRWHPDRLAICRTHRRTHEHTGAYICWRVLDTQWWFCWRLQTDHRRKTDQTLALENIQRIRGQQFEGPGADYPWCCLVRRKQGQTSFLPWSYSSKAWLLERWHTTADFVSHYLIRWKHHSTEEIVLPPRWHFCNCVHSVQHCGSWADLKSMFSDSSE